MSYLLADKAPPVSGHIVQNPVAGDGPVANKVGGVALERLDSVLKACKDQIGTVFNQRCNDIIVKHPELGSASLNTLVKFATQASQDVLSMVNAPVTSEPEVRAKILAAKGKTEEVLQCLDRLLTAEIKYPSSDTKLAWTTLAQNANTNVTNLAAKNTIAELWIPPPPGGGMASKSGQVALQNVKAHVLQAFDSEVENLLVKTEPGLQAAFKQAMGGARQELSQYTDHMIANPKITPRLLVQICDCALHEHLDKLNLRQEPQTALPIIYKYTDKQNNEKIMLTKEAPLENMVFSGGGGKGFGYIKTVDTLQEAGMFKNLKNVAGASAGAITAVGVGTGLKGDELVKFSENIQAGLHKSSHKLNSEAYPGITETLPKKGFFASLISMFTNVFKSHIWESGGGVVEAVDKQTANTVQKFLNQPDLKTFLEQKQEKLLVDGKEVVMKPEDYARLRYLADGYSHSAEKPRMHTSAAILANPELLKKDAAITFRDVELLRCLPGGSDTFKSLTISVWNKTDHISELLDAKTVPNMPIALAVRMSMSLPTVFKKVRADLDAYRETIPAKAINNPVIKEYNDGGIASNLPVEAFVKGSEANQSAAKARTLALVFDEAGKSDRALATPVGFQPSVGRIEGFIANKVTAEEVPYEDLRMLESAKKNELGNVFVVGHGDLGTTDFAPNIDRVELAHAVAKARTREWLNNYQGQGMTIQVKGPGEAAASLEPAEKQAFITHWTPERLSDLEKSHPQQWQLVSSLLVECRKI